MNSSMFRDDVDSVGLSGAQTTCGLRQATSVGSIPSRIPAGPLSKDTLSLGGCFFLSSRQP